MEICSNEDIIESTQQQKINKKAKRKKTSTEIDANATSDVKNHDKRKQKDCLESSFSSHTSEKYPSISQLAQQKNLEENELNNAEMIETNVNDRLNNEEEIEIRTNEESKDDSEKIQITERDIKNSAKKKKKKNCDMQLLSEYKPKSTKKNKYQRRYSRHLVENGETALERDEKPKPIEFLDLPLNRVLEEIKDNSILNDEESEVCEKTEVKYSILKTFILEVKVVKYNSAMESTPVAPDRNAIGRLAYRKAKKANRKSGKRGEDGALQCR